MAAFRIKTASKSQRVFTTGTQGDSRTEKAEPALRRLRSFVPDPAVGVAGLPGMSSNGLGSALPLNFPATPSSSLHCRGEVYHLEHKTKETQATQRRLFSLNNHFVIF